MIDPYKVFREIFRNLARAGLLTLNEIDRLTKADQEIIDFINNLSPDLQGTSSQNKTPATSTYTFNEFWELYNKKIGKQQTEAAFNKLEPAVLNDIKTHVQKYVKANPEKKFRSNPEKYLINKQWLDEIVSQDPAPGKKQKKVSIEPESLKNINYDD